jgi:hypothetical protein
MAITYRVAAKTDFETNFKPSIKPGSYYDVGAPPARDYKEAKGFSKKIKKR